MSDQQAATALAQRLREAAEGLDEAAKDAEGPEGWHDGVGLRLTANLVRDAAAALASPDAAMKWDVASKARRDPVTHDLKTWPEFFNAVTEGIKPFELRKNDRDYRPGDRLLLHEWNPNTRHYTTRWTARDVTYVLTGHGLQDGYAILGLASPDAAAVLGSTPRTPLQRGFAQPESFGTHTCTHCGRYSSDGHDGRCPFYALDHPEALKASAVLGSTPQEPLPMFGLAERLHQSIEQQQPSIRLSPAEAVQARDALLFQMQSRAAVLGTGTPPQDAGPLRYLRDAVDETLRRSGRRVTGADENERDASRIDFLFDAIPAERAAAAGPAPETPRQSTPEPLVALVANLIGRYANHDEDCPKRVIVGRPYPEQATCSCGYQQDAQAVFTALAAPMPHAAPGEVLDDEMLTIAIDFVEHFLDGYDDDYAQIVAVQQPKGQIAKALKLRAVLTAAAKGKA